MNSLPGDIVRSPPPRKRWGIAAVVALAALTLLTALMSAATTERFRWSRISLDAADGVTIEVAYQTKPDGREERAIPLRVRVTGERFSGSESVSVLFENYYLANSDFHEQQQMAAALPLLYAGDGRYEVDFGSAPIWYARDSGAEQGFRQQLSVTVDGHPLRGSNGESIFQFQMSR